MKKTILMLCLAISLVSCNKETNEKPKSGSLSAAEIIQNMKLASNLDPEATRVYNDVLRPKYTVAIIDNPNFGRFSPTPEYDVCISGKSKNEVRIKVDEVEYAPYDGQWLKQSIEFKNYYGKTVNIEIKSGAFTMSKSIYIPKQILVKQLSKPSSLNITRSNNVLRWTPDVNNKNQRVALFYDLYDNAEIGHDGLYKRDILILDDNGEYNIDHILADKKCKKIYFRMISGNTTSAIINGEKLLFHISSHDHHEYMVED